MRPIRTYQVTVEGYSPRLYSARSPAKARAEAYREYCSAYDCTFHRFLCISRICRVPDPPGVGERITVAGVAATRCVGSYAGYVRFMRDDSDMILLSHPLDVQLHDKPV